MNHLNRIIEKAAEKIGNQKELEAYLGLVKGNLSDVKAGKRGLPDIAQAKLEELMELPIGSLRAPSAIITEKKPERVAYWKKKLMEFEKLAACILAGVILNMTPTPSEAAPVAKSLIEQCILCQMRLPRSFPPTGSRCSPIHSTNQGRML